MTSSDDSNAIFLRIWAPDAGNHLRERLSGAMGRQADQTRVRHQPKRGVGATAVLGASASSSDVRQEAARRLAQEKLRRRKERS